MNAPRFAIYFTPARQTPLWTFGAQWLGRDDDNAEYDLAPPFKEIPPEEHAAMTAAPRHYGFHATLKSPFALADGRSAENLRDALSDFAKNQPPFPGPLLQIGEMNRFIALIPMAENGALGRFASECVRAFDGFRRAETPEQIARRHAQDLTPRQRSLLAAWGYPFVFEEFRFHMTLTDQLKNGQKKRPLTLLRRHFTEIAETPLWLDAISLFQQPDRGAPFTLAERYLLRG
ncbi:DUF1045 domain-containing protein [Varunaivibrio sulfuroxidans]|uniref:Putative phosphonate metabolism protein n=1 Tax=Varunaivibrio sulfuroxidans TaxID=1773489 RepID=A0A4V2UP86_9PROT|nr:DUF1045 domain-containing protein [Varunaivibrio sulfuroxidans]TCS64951.1 putative phosphonate metabolism protein [Varunaivibrio sulfuroxidans]WES29757.1 DUF1045 domain-containing protein [Varunaivibrio sulfuroxidans]